MGPILSVGMEAHTTGYLVSLPLGLRIRAWFIRQQAHTLVAAPETLELAGTNSTNRLFGCSGGFGAETFLMGGADAFDLSWLSEGRLLYHDAERQRVLVRRADDDIRTLTRVEPGVDRSLWAVAGPGGQRVALARFRDDGMSLSIIDDAGNLVAGPGALPEGLPADEIASIDGQRNVDQRAGRSTRSTARDRSGV